MLKNRTSWILILAALTALSFACSKQEESPPERQNAAEESAAQQTKERTGNDDGQESDEMKSAGDSNSGEAIYTQHCASCHDSGLAGAPKTGDKEAWADHIAHGMQHMVTNAINGIGSMPPKGGAAGLSDEEVRAAVAYMVEESQ